MWQDTTNQYSASSSHNPYYGQTPQQSVPLQFYAPGPDQGQFYPGSRSSLEGNMGGGQAPIGQGGAAPAFGGNIQQQPGGWWTAFGTGGFEGEPPLLEELGINFSHIRAKSMTVLNPLRRVDERIMDDADLAGPLLFFFCFGVLLLLSGKPQFGYIYGFGLLGSVSIYTLLNLMSENGIDAYRVVSVLGYCLLPMVGVGAISVVVTLECVIHYFAPSLQSSHQYLFCCSGILGYVLSLLSIIWCTFAASGIFVAVLRMSDQRLLVAYPVALLYGCFGLLSVFNVGAGSSAR
ncbi:Yip1-domain-containing protein [Suillus paluster]|uniref:Yip1-domain-containing protein n=1 Tax=Suillus paluster TaxID=48578 RepID=UPI001B884146|nr:Yip1-domain-containing protein [Suillus paluster]KAG1732207.1 Yip1-domain-containing protein [Suillus paluster]